MNTVIIGVDVVEGQKVATFRVTHGREFTEVSFPFPLNDNECDFAREICTDAEELYGSSSLDFPHECGFTADEVEGLLTDIFGKRGTDWV